LRITGECQREVGNPGSIRVRASFAITGENLEAEGENHKSYIGFRVK